ncbi:hypothetical protein Hanom_Chr06g00578451 [Helianthus anomalus]
MEMFAILLMKYEIVVKWLGKDSMFLVTQVKGEYGWRRIALDGRRVFTDYSTVVPSGGCRLGFRASGRVKGLAAVE